MRPSVGGAERPVEVGRVAARRPGRARRRTVASTASTSRESTAMFVGRARRRSGRPGWCRSRATARPGRSRTCGRRPRRGRPGMMPSRRSPSSTISTTSWHALLRDSGAAESSARTSTSVLRLRSALSHDPVDLAQHRRADRGSSGGDARPGAAPRGSRCASRRARDHAGCRSSRATSGDPSVALVTPVTEMPRAASRSTSVRALWCDPVEVDLQPRGASSSGWRASLESRSGNACTTISTSGPVERVSASVAGMPSSSS